MKLLTTLAAVAAAAATSTLALPVSVTEVPEHRYAFHAPTWNPFASSNKPHPLVLWHGLGDSGYSDGMMEFKTTLESAYPGMYVHLVTLGDNAGSDRNRGVFGNVNEDIEQVCSDLSQVDELKGGFDAMGFSQGGQFLRALVQRCDKVQVRNLVTLGSQHMGISDLPACSPADLLCRLAEGALRGGVYSDYAQTHIVTAQYFRDPRTREKLAKYLEANHFLTDINNEVEQNEVYKQRLSALETFVMFQFDQDKTVVPKRSSWFESFPTKEGDGDDDDDDGDSSNPKEETIPLRQSEIYNSDRLGLKTLDKRGALVLDTCKGRHMEINTSCQLKIFGKYVATPKTAFPPRAVSHLWARILYATTGMHASGLAWTTHLNLFVLVLFALDAGVVLAAYAVRSYTSKRRQSKEGTIRL